MISALLLKALISGGIVAAAAVVAQRLGPLWGGLVATLPVSAGPAYAMLAFYHSAEFVGEAAESGLATGIATALLLWILVIGLPRIGLLATLALATLAWLAVALAVLAWAPGFWLALALNGLGFGLAIRGTSGALKVAAPAVIRIAPWWELPVRSAVLGLLVATVVALSGELGAVLTGMVAVYPVALTTLALVAVPRLGRLGAAALLAGAARGMPGFVLFVAVMAQGAAPLGVALALLLGLAVVLGWGGVVLFARRVMPMPTVMKYDR